MAATRFKHVGTGLTLQKTAVCKQLTGTIDDLSTYQRLWIRIVAAWQKVSSSEHCKCKLIWNIPNLNKFADHHVPFHSDVSVCVLLSQLWSHTEASSWTLESLYLYLPLPAVSLTSWLLCSWSPLVLFACTLFYISAGNNGTTCPGLCQCWLLICMRLEEPC